MTSPLVSKADHPAKTGARALHIVLWVVQALLAVMFGTGGVMKATQPIAELAEKLVWPGVLHPAMVRFIGVAELFGALGLILPAATRIKPVLTPLAATGLVVIMLLAMAFHLSRGELQALPINVTLGALAGFVAWGRYRRAPIASR